MPEDSLARQLWNRFTGTTDTLEDAGDPALRAAKRSGMMRAPATNKDPYIVPGVVRSPKPAPPVDKPQSITKPPTPAPPIAKGRSLRRR